MRHAAWFVVLAAGAGCIDPQSDEDGDGLVYERELEVGTDPKIDDSDGDGLTDGQEVDFGTDPLDKASGRYEGGWPRQTVAFKDAVVASGKTGKEIDTGKRFPRLIEKDQHGEEVDLYDLSGHGRKIIVDVSAEWCGPCKQISTILGDKDTTDPLFQPIVGMIRAGLISWVTVLSEDVDGEAPKPRIARTWERDFPARGVMVLGDTEAQLLDYVVASTGAWPSFVILNENMKVVEYGTLSDPGMQAA
ncbi:MAG: thioredoxin family protein, partial [Myxococcales bacterium]|nr:thioredoxin family protein [Myxococcales bacterium]